MTTEHSATKFPSHSAASSDRMKTKTEVSRAAAHAGNTPLILSPIR